MSDEDMAALGESQIVYLRRVRAAVNDGAISMHSAAGQRLGLYSTVDQALAAAQMNDLTVMRRH